MVIRGVFFLKLLTSLESGGVCVCGSSDATQKAVLFAFLKKAYGVLEMTQ